MSIQDVTTVASMRGADLSQYDIETAIALCFMGRAENLNRVTQEEMRKVQSTNAKIATNLDAVSSLNRLLAEFSADAKTSSTINDQGKFSAGDHYANFEATQKATAATGMTLFTNGQGTPTVSPHWSTTKSQLDAAVKTLTAKNDSMTTSQQEDMQRLNSCTTKHAQCFELMTNVSKKKASTLDAIIGNMR